jgi:ketosteroid isomerase-like protein
MPDGNPETVRRVIDAWNHGNVDRMVEFWTEDGDWVWEDPPDFPDAKVVRGRADVEAHLRDLVQLLGEMHGGIEDLVELSQDELMICVQFRMKGASSGVPLDVRTFQLFSFDEGRIRRQRVFTDRDQALGAAKS